MATLKRGEEEPRLRAYAASRTPRRISSHLTAVVTLRAKIFSVSLGGGDQTRSDGPCGQQLPRNIRTRGRPSTSERAHKTLLMDRRGCVQTSDFQPPSRDHKLPSPELSSWCVVYSSNYRGDGNAQSVPTISHFGNSTFPHILTASEVATHAHARFG